MPHGRNFIHPYTTTQIIVVNSSTEVHKHRCLLLALAPGFDDHVSYRYKSSIPLAQDAGQRIRRLDIQACFSLFPETEHESDHYGEGHTFSTDVVYTTDTTRVCLPAACLQTSTSYISVRLPAPGCRTSGVRTRVKEGGRHECRGSEKVEMRPRCLLEAVKGDGR